MSDTTPEETNVASDAPAEEEGGSQHFAIGDLPPGVDSAESEPATTDEDSGGVTEEEGATSVTPPPETFWSFRTADGQERTFSSQDEAQQFFSSWNGRLSKAERELNEVTSLNYQWQKAYESGELGGTPVPEGKELKEAAQAAEDSGALRPHDWAAVNQYIKDGKGDTALQYIQWRNGEYLKEQVEGLEQRFEAKLSELTAPQQFQREVSEGMTYVAQSAQAAVNDMGEPLYPEFQDGDKYDSDFTKHFRDVWLAQDYRLAMDPNGTGFKAAYYEAKATYRPPVDAPVAPAAPSIGETMRASAASTAPRNPDGTFAKRNQALSMSDSDGVGSGSPTGTPPKTSILDAMREVGNSRSKHFAVAPD